MADGCAVTDWLRKTAVYVWSESYLTAAFAADKRLGLRLIGRGSINCASRISSPSREGLIRSNLLTDISVPNMAQK